MDIQIAKTSEAGSGRRQLVSLNGRVSTLGELTAGDIVGALPSAKLAQLRAGLGLAAGPSGARSMRAGSASQRRIHAVVDALANDDNCKGKAGLALAMLADDDFASLNADALVKVLSSSPAPSSGGSDPEAAARAVMKEALSSGKNSSICAVGGAYSETPVATWDKAIAAVNSQQGGR